jgi:hypothetical protein
MAEGTSEASAARKRKLGQRFHPDFILLPYKIDTGTLCLLQTKVLNNRNPSSAYHYAILPDNEASK